MVYTDSREPTLILVKGNQKHHILANSDQASTSSPASGKRIWRFRYQICISSAELESE